MQHRHPQYYGLEQLDKKLEAFIDYDNGYFVELGANDGITQSNTYYFETYRKWHGVLIEPVLHNFFQCKKVRSPRNKILCNACVSFEYTADFVPILYCNLMSTPINVSSDIERPVQHVLEGQKHLAQQEEPVLFGAHAKTLNSILIEAGSPENIDLLSLDVEGGELEVLKGVDFKKFSFKYICIECRNIKKMVTFLHGHGYELVKHLQLNDYLFKSSNV